MYKRSYGNTNDITIPLENTYFKQINLQIVSGCAKKRGNLILICYANVMIILETTDNEMVAT